MRLWPTVDLASYRAAFRELDCGDRHRPGRMLDNHRTENSRLLISDYASHVVGAKFAFEF
jgi:hypothetical protein